MRSRREAVLGFGSPKIIHEYQDGELRSPKSQEYRNTLPSLRSEGAHAWMQARFCSQTRSRERGAEMLHRDTHAGKGVCSYETGSCEP